MADKKEIHCSISTVAPLHYVATLAIFKKLATSLAFALGVCYSQLQSNSNIVYMSA